MPKKRPAGRSDDLIHIGLYYMKPTAANPVPTYRFFIKYSVYTYLRRMETHMEYVVEGDRWLDPDGTYIPIGTMECDLSPLTRKFYTTCGTIMKTLRLVCDLDQTATTRQFVAKGRQNA